MMGQFFEDFELMIVITLTLMAKFLMSEEPVAEDESPQQKVARRKRTYGGMIAGVLCGYYGPELLIQWSSSEGSLFEGIFSQDLIVPMTIILVISGEHIFRALITKLPSWIEMFAEKRISK